MRLVRSPREMETSLPLARSEAQAAFGDDSIYFEKWIEESRHVEVQVLVDQHGNGVHLGERDCSIQRRHQKIIEEAPSPAMDDAARERLRDLAIRAVVAAGYESAGTLEFLLDKEGNFYFIEINCRIQVEHPVTEMLTGLDLIARADPAGRRRAALVHAGAGPPGWARHRVPHQRRGSRRQLLAADRRGGRAAAARRSGRARRHAPVRRLRGAAVLRLAARQADRVGRHPTDRAGAGAARPGRVQGRRPEDEPALPSWDDRQRRLPARRRSAPTCSIGLGRRPSWPAAHSFVEPMSEPMAFTRHRWKRPTSCGSFRTATRSCWSTA